MVTSDSQPKRSLEGQPIGHLTKTLAVFCLLITSFFFQRTHAALIEWGAGFDGFRTGDVYFASSVFDSSGNRIRNTTLFRYTPSASKIFEVTSLGVPTGSPNASLAFDPLGRGLFVGDVNSIRLLRSDGRLVDFATPLTTLLDLAVGPAGTVYAGDAAGISAYKSDGTADRVAALAAPVRGVALRPDGGFAAGIDQRPSVFGSDNLLFLDSEGNIESQFTVGDTGLGKIRALDAEGGGYGAIGDSRTTLYAVTDSGSARAVADSTDGIFQSDGLAVADGQAWVTTRGRPASAQRFAFDGALLESLSLEIPLTDPVVGGGFFSPSGIAVTPAAPTTVDAPPPLLLLLLGLGVFAAAQRMNHIQSTSGHSA